MGKYILLCATTLLFACGPSKSDVEKIKQELADSLNTQHAKEINKIEGTFFKTLQSSNFNIDNLNYQGKVVYRKFWQDSNGENIVLFTRNREELFVFHYAIHNNQVNLLRKVYDFETDCEDDLIIQFIENSIGVTDLDNDNFGEITFAYKKTCTTDVSPLTLKLLTLENGQKYIIRGTTKPKGIDYGGKKNIDASFNKAPSVILSNANKVWDEIVEQ